MPITGDLVNLDKLVLTDTFNTWLNRTNQIIDSINPFQVYTVDVGVGSTAVDTGAGLSKYTGEVAGNYNGVITVGLNPGPGVGYESISGQSRSIIDFSNFATYNRILTGQGVSSDNSRVSSEDEFIVNDTSDTTTSASGTSKKVKARNILPPEVAMDLLTISGNVSIKGNLSIFGSNSFIASNDLQIEDKQIEIAYQQAIPLGMTGVTSGSFPLTGGQTAYYFVNATTASHAFYGHLQSFTAAAAGPTGTLVIGSLFGSLINVNNSYGPEDFAATGYISLSSTGSTRFLYDTKGAIFSSFLNDQNLDEAGIVVKGSDSDKNWLWIYSDNDTGAIYNSWMANTNIGVEGNTNAVISRVYRSYGYTGINNSEFIIAAENGKNAQIYLAETSGQTVPLTFTGGSWRIERNRTNNYLVFSTGATGISGVSENFLITPGASGQTFAGVSVNNYAKNFNADLLDGAHASLVPAPYVIPITDSSGKIDSGFASGDSIRKRYTQPNHGLAFGMAVRVIPSVGGFTSALATNEEYAEAIGIVDGVYSSSEFSVVHQGRIENINSTMRVEGVAFDAGKVYFLGASASNRGKLIEDPYYNNSTRLVTGQVRKPLLLALSATQGYVLDYVGSKVPSSASTDKVYLSGLVPVGTIQAYSGNLANITSEWLVCNGYRYRALDYPELYITIQKNYYGFLQVTTANNIALGIVTGNATVVNGARNIEVGDIYTVTRGGISYQINVNSVDVAEGTIVFQSVSQIDVNLYRLNANVNSSGENIFFVPDLRARSIVGSSTGGSEYTTTRGLFEYQSTQVGGTESVSINNTNLPAHGHDRAIINANVTSGSTQLVTEINNTLGRGVATGNPIFVRNLYLTTHYIIRAKAETEATVLTGHNHDTRYHLLNDNIKISGQGSFRVNPEVNGPTVGFNVYLDSSVYGRTANILSCFAPLTPYTGFPNSLPRLYEARTKVNAFGDFVVWGNGLSSFGGHTFAGNRPIFSFFTHNSSFTIEGGTGGLSAPSINFYTIDSGNLGRIEGLANAPRDDASAVNKYYTDTSDKIATAPNITTYGDWNVSHPLGSLPFGIAGRGNSILKTSWSQSSSLFNDSKLQTEVYGDFTVWGDGLGGNPNITGHSNITFAVDPLKSEVTVEGEINNSSRPAPVLTFRNSSAGGSLPAIGTVAGLTFPTRGDHAANKDYVDKYLSNQSFVEQLFNIQNYLGTDGGAEQVGYGINMDDPIYKIPNLRRWVRSGSGSESIVSPTKPSGDGWNNIESYQNITFEGVTYPVGNTAKEWITSTVPSSGNWLIWVTVEADDGGDTASYEAMLPMRIRCGSNFGTQSYSNITWSIHRTGRSSSATNMFAINVPNDNTSGFAVQVTRADLYIGKILLSAMRIGG